MEGSDPTVLALDGATIRGGKLATFVSAVIETVSGSSNAIRAATVTPETLVVVMSGSTLLLSGGTIGVGATVEAASGGTAIVSGTVTNGGVLFASGLGSLVEITSGAVVNGGVAEIGDGVADIAGFGSENVSFLSTGSGGLEIADTQVHTSAFGGRVSGFGGSGHSNQAQFIDLMSVTSAGAITSSYVSGNLSNTSGTLFVSSGVTLVAAIKMVGSYSAGDFHIASGNGGVVEITDPTVPNGGSVTSSATGTFPQHGIDLPNIAFGAQTTLAYSENAAGTDGTLTVSDGRHAASIALLGNYIAESFVATTDGHGGTLITEASQVAQQPLLAHPRPT